MIPLLVHVLVKSLQTVRAAAYRDVTLQQCLQEKVLEATSRPSNSGQQISKMWWLPAWNTMQQSEAIKWLHTTT